jgi:hypothetical protein
MWIDNFKTLLNVYNTAVLGRRTAEEQMWFYLTMSNGQGAAQTERRASSNLTGERSRTTR